MNEYARSAEPSEDETRNCNEIVERLTTLFGSKNQLVKGQIAVQKGGSLAKGTAVKGKSDCDLVLVVPGFTPDKLPALQQKCKVLLTGARLTGTPPDTIKDNRFVFAVCTAL